MDNILQYLISTGHITQEKFDSLVEQERVKLQDNPNSPQSKISLLSENTKTDFEQVKLEKEIKLKIDNGEISANTFSTLTEDEQSIARLVLFKQYSPDLSLISKALSSAEFALVALTKLMDKTMDKTKLTTEEQSFFADLVATFSLNDMPINDSTDWRMQYLMNEFSQVQQNRAEYFNKKTEITGV